MQAGENTLEAQLTRLAVRHMTMQGEFIADVFRDEYLEFMQNPGSHNDTYAAKSHRMFFKNLSNGIDLKNCPDNISKNVDTMDALTVTIPVILRYLEADSEVRNAKVIEAIKVTRGIQSAEIYAIVLSDLIVGVVNGVDLRIACQEAATKIGYGDLKTMVAESLSDPMAACYIDINFRALLFIVYKYADSVEKAILANANAGGENVARGSILGALIGASHGMSGFPEWTNSLLEKEKIMTETKQFLITI